MEITKGAIFPALTILVSLAFAWILWPFYGAVLWAVVFAIVFAPIHRAMRRLMPRSPGVATFLVVLVIVVIVILPLGLVAIALVQEASGLYAKAQSGEMDLVRLFSRVLDGLPTWASSLMRRFELTSLGALQETISKGALKSGPFFAAEAFSLGQTVFGFALSLFVLLYLLFYLLRDEATLRQRIRSAIPLADADKNALFERFAVVVRATVKGDMFMALLQGALGGLMFWFLGIEAPLLWTASMAFLSLLPAVGSSLVWGPVAIYCLVTGSTWQGVLLIAYGALVIGLVDNFLRPLLIGNDTKMPSYVVLVSTLGGIEIFGLNGFVVGPMIAAMFITVWDIFSEARRATPRQ